MIIRTEKNKNFTTVSNECFQNPNISARAKGVFAYIMTLPDHWKLKKSEIAKHFAEGEKAINTAFNELIEHGYIQQNKVRNEKGHFEGCEYVVFEFLNTIQSLTSNRKAGNGKRLNRQTVKPFSDNRLGGNRQLVNTNEVNTRNNIVNNVVSQDSKSTPTRSLKIVDLANIPEFTQDKVISDTPTVNQIDSIETISETYEVVGSKLFETVIELSNTKADFFEDFNQILAVAINQQLEPLVQAKELEAERAKCKYEIDFRATEMANDERSIELDDTQVYAVDHNLKYLQKIVGKNFDFDELKGWVTHSLKHGYKGVGFQKAMRCIVKAIKEDNFTRPYSLKDNYLEKVG